MTIRPRRSALYMPASNARAIEKARGLPCDVVILDLEDAVAPDAKAQARDAAGEAVHIGGFGAREVVIRVNGADTQWGADDLAAAVAARPDAILLPKLESPAMLAAARRGAGDVPLWAMIETGRGVLDLPAIADAAAGEGLVALVAGTNDLAKEMRCRPGATRAPLLPVLTRIVLAARMAGLAALDGVCNALDDPDRLAAECRQGLEWGFDGKTLIHPAQIDTANAVFSPTEEEIGWARSVVAAFADPDHAARGAIRVEGQMVERLHLEEAERTLAIADRIGAGAG